MFQSFAMKLIMMTAVLAVIIAAIHYLVPAVQSFQFFTWSSLLFFFGITLMTGFIGFRGLEKTAHGFVASVNGMVVLKLFMSVIFIIVYVLIAKPHSPLFISSFFFLYVVYAVFEIRELIIAQKIRRKQLQDDSS